MGLYNRKKASAESAETPLEQGRTPSRRRAAITPLEIKQLALEALQNGLTRSEVAEIIGVSAVTIGAWQKKYDSEGLRGLYRRSSSIKYKASCRTLEQRILERRGEHPERGVRRIRDDLRRQEGLSVSAETVRTVVNEAGVGNPPKKPGPRPPQVRRFERPLPNALWQIDIFTFQLKRMYVARPRSWRRAGR